MSIFEENPLSYAAGAIPLLLVALGVLLVRYRNEVANYARDLNIHLTAGSRESTTGRNTLYPAVGALAIGIFAGIRVWGPAFQEPTTLGGNALPHLILAVLAYVSGLALMLFPKPFSRLFGRNHAHQMMTDRRSRVLFWIGVALTCAGLVLATALWNTVNSA